MQKDENLFISEGQWDARYIPLCAQAKPFFIGPGREGQDDDGQQWVIHVDMDSPKLNTESGIALFKDFGGNSSYIDRTSEILRAVHEGITEVKPFTELLTKYDLLESFKAETTLANGQKYRLDGFYTINEEKLSALPGEILSKLLVNGWLGSIYTVIASMANFRALIERKNCQCAVSSIPST